MKETLSVTEKSVVDKKDSFCVIGIGSSAGGLRALEEFFDYCPSDTGYAFVVIQHLSPDHKSLMAELLSRHTAMSVKEAKEGDVVKPNHVYLIPGIKNLEIKNGKLELSRRPPSNKINFSIDLFFNSLAIEKKEKAVAVILSGTGSDGTKGAKAIKEIGGSVFVQSPDSSGFDGMPISAISHGLADYVLDPKDMGVELVNLISSPDHIFPVVSRGGLTNDESLKLILQIIKKEGGHDFFNYKKPTLLRRTAKRVHITKCQTVEDYIEYLHEYPDEKYLLTQEFLVGVTQFFRDDGAFKIIKEKVIPAIVAKKTEHDTIKIWVVACSTGEEAYSIAILLEEYLRKMNLDIRYKIFATDLNEQGVKVATKGVYSKSIVAGMPAKILEKYFIEKKESYQIAPVIRKNIVFSKHDIIQNPPFSKMDLISCRNMLIYMDTNVQREVLSSLHFALNLHGYLFLGSSESLGTLDKNFEGVNGKWRIFKNTQPERILTIKTGNVWRVEKEDETRLKRDKKGSTIEDMITTSMTKMIMDKMQVVSVCIDENYEILRAKGMLKKYIKYIDEGYSNNLLKILPDELNIAITSSVRKLSNAPEQTIEKEVKIVIDENLKLLRVLVSSVDVVSATSRSFLILIIEDSNRKITEVDKISLPPTLISNEEYVQELKDALNETRVHLQSAKEESDTSNEEMQATNEELLASNEELQSTNEELQSLNEELHTVNAELQEKNIELFELHSDVENLMKNINIGTIFLDRSFQIRKFTPAIGEHFQLRDQDIGRSIAHFSGTMGGDDLVVYCKEVMTTLQPYSKEVKNPAGEWFIMRVYPYISQENAIHGVVINFVNINELKSAINEKEKLNNSLTHLMDSNPAGIYVYDVDKKENIYNSSSLEQISGYSSKDLEKLGDLVLEKMVHPDDLDKVYVHHERLKHIKDGEVLQIEYRIIHKITKAIVWLLSSDKVDERNKDGRVKTILGVNQVITKSKDMQFKLAESEERFRLAIRATRSGLWEWSDLEADKAWYSKEFYELLGYTPREVKSSFSGFIKLIHPEQTKIFRAGIEQYVEKEEAFEEEIRIKTKKNGYKWFRINGQMKHEENQKTVKKIVGTLLDIDDRKESENKMQELNIELERFAYLASHDLKEPLRTVTSFTKLFKKEYGSKLDDNAFMYLDFIENASSRMITLTNDLLVYSQLDDKSLNFESVNLHELIANIKEDFFKTIAENKAEISIDKLPNIVCDASQIKQLFQNLISNSLKYRGERNPKIQISCVKKSTYFEFCVKDNGIGISEEYYTNIFEVFKRLHSQIEYEGTGIGLANCKRIVDNHKGKIWVKSIEGSGSEFFFKIPKLKMK